MCGNRLGICILLSDLFFGSFPPEAGTSVKFMYQPAPEYCVLSLKEIARITTSHLELTGLVMRRRLRIPSVAVAISKQNERWRLTTLARQVCFFSTRERRYGAGLRYVPSWVLLEVCLSKCWTEDKAFGCWSPCGWFDRLGIVARLKWH